MKTAILIILFSALVSICLTFMCACSTTPQQQQQLETVGSNLLKDGTAAALGYASGGKVGAIAGAGSQIIANHAPTAKQPRDVQP